MRLQSINTGYQIKNISFGSNQADIKDIGDNIASFITEPKEKDGSKKEDAIVASIAAGAAVGVKAAPRIKTAFQGIQQYARTLLADKSKTVQQTFGSLEKAIGKPAQAVNNRVFRAVTITACVVGGGLLALNGALSWFNGKINGKMI